MVSLPLRTKWNKKTVWSISQALILACVMFLARGDALAQSKQNITILGGSAGGLWAIITEGLGEAIRRTMTDVNVTTEPGKDGPNQVMVSRGEVQFAVANEGLTVAAIEGLDPYKKRLPNLRSVAVLNPTSTFQFIIDKKTGLTSIDEIKAKKYPLRVAVNRQGTLMEISAQKVFAAYGISFEDIEKWGGKVHKIPGPEAMDLWDAGQLDAIVEFSQYPSSRFIEHSKKHELAMLPISQDKMAEVCKQLGSTPAVMPKGSYPFQPEDCPTINTKLLLITSAEQSDAVVQGVLKAMVANLDYLHKVHANLQDLSPQLMSDGLLVELHPAAKAFYREQGALK